MFDITDDEDDMGDQSNLRHRGYISIPNNRLNTDDADDESQKGTSEAEIADLLTRSPPPIEGKNDLSPPGGTTSVGLAKSVEERLTIPGRQRRRTIECQDEGEELADEVTRIRISDGQ